MGSTSTAIGQLASQVSAVNQTAALLLASIGQGQFDPEKIKQAIQDATQEAIDEVLKQLDGMDVTELNARTELQRRLLEIQNAVDPDSKFCFEFFNSLYSLADTITISGASTVAGDDSVDCDSTAGLVVGREYVIETQTQQAIVTVSEILTATRFLVTADIPVSMTGATIRRTNWTFVNNRATAKAGQVYYSEPLTLDATIASDKALVIRKSETSKEPIVYFMDGSRPVWQKAEWKWKRSSAVGFTGGGEEGYNDVEYVVPTSGTFSLKIVAQDAVNIRHIVGVSRDTRLKGTPRPADAPTNLSPAANAVSIGKTPTMQLSAYYHPAKSVQNGVRIQVSKSAADFTGSNLVYDSGNLSAATGAALPATVLAESTDYYWRGCYTDYEGGISDWSTVTKFTTANAFATFTVNTPAVTTPAANATKVSKKPTITASAFAATGGTAVQLATRYQVSSDALFSTVNYDSGTDAVNRSSYTLTEAQALAAGDHFVRVMEQGGFVWEANASGGTEAVLSANTIANAVSVALDENRVLVCYTDTTDSSKGKAVVLTINPDRTVSPGTAVVFNASATNYLAAVKINTDKVMVGYYGTSGYGYAVVLSVSGTTVTANAALTVLSATVAGVAITAFDTDKAVVAFTNSTTNGSAYVLTAIGTNTITAGSVATFNSGSTTAISIAAMDNAKVLIAYKDSTNYGAAIACSISGTTLLAGAKVTFTGTNVVTSTSLVAVNATTAVVGYIDTTDGNTAKYKKITLQGTACNASYTPQIALVGTPATSFILNRIDATRFLVTVAVSPQNYVNTSVVYFVNDTEMVQSDAFTIQSSTGATSIAPAYTANTKLVMVYNLTGGKARCMKLYSDSIWSDWSAAVKFNVQAFTRFVTRLIGTSGSAYFYGVAAASDGSLYAAGQDSSGGTDDAILAKFGSDGTLVWQKKIGGSGSDDFSHVVVASDGSIYVAGYEQSSASSREILVAKFASDGTLTWQKKIGGNYSDTGVSIAVSSSGSVYVVGSELSSSGNTYEDAFIAKFASDGTLTWQKKLGGNYTERFMSVAVSLDGSVYAVGYENSSTGGNNNAGLIAKFTTDGTLVWQKNLGGSNDDGFNGVAVAADGSVYAVGYENSSNGGGVNYEALVAKFTTDGALSWQKKLYGSMNDQFSRIAIGADGGVYVVGFENSSTGGNYEALVAKFTSDGALTWQKKLGGSGNEYFYGASVGGVDNNLCLCGGESSTVSRAAAIIVSISPDADGTSGTIPSIPALSWGNPGLSLTAEAFTSANPSLTVTAESLTLTTSTLTLSDPALTATRSEY